MREPDAFEQWLNLACTQAKLHCKMYILLLIEDGLQQLRRDSSIDKAPSVKEPYLSYNGKPYKEI